MFYLPTCVSNRCMYVCRYKDVSKKISFLINLQEVKPDVLKNRMVSRDWALWIGFYFQIC